MWMNCLLSRLAVLKHYYFHDDYLVPFQPLLTVCAFSWFCSHRKSIWRIRTGGKARTGGRMENRKEEDEWGSLLVYTGGANVRRLKRSQPVFNAWWIWTQLQPYTHTSWEWNEMLLWSRKQSIVSFWGSSTRPLLPFYAICSLVSEALCRPIGKKS